MGYTNDITQAIQNEVRAGLPYPVVRENSDGIPDRPYVVLQVVRIKPQALTNEAHVSVRRGYLIATVVTEAGTLAKQGDDIGDEIAEILPFAHTIDVGSRVLTVNNIPYVDIGFRDGNDWRTPVRIDYEVD